MEFLSRSNRKHCLDLSVHSSIHSSFNSSIHLSIHTFLHPLTHSSFHPRSNYFTHGEPSPPRGRPSYSPNGSLPPHGGNHHTPPGGVVQKNLPIKASRSENHHTPNRIESEIESGSRNRKTIFLTNFWTIFTPLWSQFCTTLDTILDTEIFVP
jgi:hypothetical protein